METELKRPIFVGCAGWNLPKASADKFDGDGTHLQRYATRFNCVEINSSFYRPHRRSTYERWAASVPAFFRFAVKVPKAITHTARLKPTDDELARFCSEASGLGDRLGCLLVQLPPSLEFHAEEAAKFFSALESQKPSDAVAVVCEPRHLSWFTLEANQMLEQFGVSRVLADPPIAANALEGDHVAAVTYLRLHGSPRMYYSAYSPTFIQRCAEKLLASTQAGSEGWCIFDNTALGAATDDALTLLDELERRQGRLLV